jgi:hypothetical protein
VTKALAVALSLAIFVSSGAEAKRKRIPRVNPIISSGLEFSLLTRVDEKGLDVWLTSTVTAKNSAKPFRKLVYRISFDPRMETDVQAIYPVSMNMRRGVVRVMDERGNYHKVPVMELTGTGTGTATTAR